MLQTGNPDSGDEVTTTEGDGLGDGESVSKEVHSHGPATIDGISAQFCASI